MAGAELIEQAGRDPDAVGLAGVVDAQVVARHDLDPGVTQAGEVARADVVEGRGYGLVRFASVKAMRSMRKWAYEMFADDRAVKFIAMATPEDLRANAEYIRMADECVALYKQSYSLEKEVSGHESPLLAVHLQKLGAAYERQGKMEAASLTLREAGDVLEEAYGPDHPEVRELRQKLDDLDGGRTAARHLLGKRG